MHEIINGSPRCNGGFFIAKPVDYQYKSSGTTLSYMTYYQYLRPCKKTRITEYSEPERFKSTVSTKEGE